MWVDKDLIEPEESQADEGRCARFPAYKESQLHDDAIHTIVEDFE